MKNRTLYTYRVTRADLLAFSLLAAFTAFSLLKAERIRALQGVKTETKRLRYAVEDLNVVVGELGEDVEDVSEKQSEE